MARPLQRSLDHNAHSSWVLRGLWGARSAILLALVLLSLQPAVAALEVKNGDLKLPKGIEHGAAFTPAGFLVNGKAWTREVTVPADAEVRVP